MNNKIIYFLLSIIVITCVITCNIHAVVDTTHRIHWYFENTPLVSQSYFTEQPIAYYYTPSGKRYEYWVNWENGMTGIVEGKLSVKQSLPQPNGYSTTKNTFEQYFGAFQAQTIGFQMVYRTSSGYSIQNLKPNTFRVEYFRRVSIFTAIQFEIPETEPIPPISLFSPELYFYGSNADNRVYMATLDNYNRHVSQSPGYSNIVTYSFEWHYDFDFDSEYNIFGYYVYYRGDFDFDNLYTIHLLNSDLLGGSYAYLPIDQDNIDNVVDAESSLNGFTDGLSDFVYTQISPLTNGIYFQKLTEGSRLSNALINRLTELPWLHYMLVVSLAVGVVGFLFSFTGKVHR